MKLGFRAEQAWNSGLGHFSAKALRQKLFLADICAKLVRDRPSGGRCGPFAITGEICDYNPPISIGSSYLLTRPGRLTRYLGPCVADDPRSAHALIQGAVQQSAYEWSWDLLPENVHAVAIAQELSFAPNRHLLRMVRGKDLRAQEEAIYAIAGFELG
jgi:hypothetical protein